MLISKNKLLQSLNESNLESETAEKIKDVSEILSGTLSEVREISYNLHPYQIERLGLSKAIRSIVDRVAESAEISFTCVVDEIDNLLSPEAEITLYRIIQESINNILKHSEASEAILNVSKNNNEISVFVSDNGKGISADSISVAGNKPGLGLEGMKERARIINASFRVETANGYGTIVKVVLPIIGSSGDSRVSIEHDADETI